MKKKTLLTVAAIFAAMTMLAGCADKENSAQSGQSSQSDTTQESSTPESSVDSSDASAESTTSADSSASTESSTSTDSSSSAESSSSTESAAASEKPVTVSELSLKDGEYSIAVTLEGGSGKVTAVSPTKLIIKDGAASAEVELSSSKYDYMKVDGVRYDMINTEGNSKFLIPVAGFDFKMPVSANTTAMGNPHEIDYTLFFDSKTIS